MQLRGRQPREDLLDVCSARSPTGIRQRVYNEGIESHFTSRRGG